jgi:hypothetical protein
VRRRGELGCIFAIGNFVIVQGEPALQLFPGFKGQVRNGAMIGMIIDKPMGKNRIWILRFKKALECLVMWVVDNGVAVDLIGIGGPGLQDLTCLFRFGMRTAAAVSQAPSFRYSNTTWWPSDVSRAMVPPQPYSGSPGCPPVITILHVRSGGAAPEPCCPTAFTAAAPATTPPAFSMSRRFIPELSRPTV